MSPWGNLTPEQIREINLQFLAALAHVRKLTVELNK